MFLPITSVTAALAAFSLVALSFPVSLGRSGISAAGMVPTYTARLVGAGTPLLGAF